MLGYVGFVDLLGFVYYDCRGKEQTTIAASDSKFHQRFHAQWNTYIIYLCTMVKLECWGYVQDVGFVFF